MDDSSEPSNAIVVHSPSYPLSPIFPFGRLPSELRIEVLVAARAYPWDPEPLLLVCKEFHQVIAPHRFERINIREEDDCTPAKVLAQLRNLFTTVLPRYGSFVKTLDLFVTRVEKAHATRMRTAVSQVMASVPNLAMLSTNASFADIISVSPATRSLTYLDIRGPTDTASKRAAKLISRCLNLTKLELVGLHVSDHRHPLLPAIASHPSLTDLILDACILPGDSLATADWRRCSLKTLEISSQRYTHDIPFHTFRTFVSHFSSTLTRLEISPDSPLWYHNSAITNIPITLPHLATLKLDWSDVRRWQVLPKTASRIYSLFDDSPIKDAYLALNAGTLESSPTAIIKTFIDAHKGTLKTLKARPAHGDDATPLELQALVPYAKGLGIELEIEAALHWK